MRVEKLHAELFDKMQEEQRVYIEDLKTKTADEILNHAYEYLMILIGSNPDYLKTSWVKDEWRTFNNEIREGRKNGNLILLLADDIAGDKGRLPGQLRQKEIVKMSEFRSRLLAYLR